MQTGVEIRWNGWAVHEHTTPVRKFSLAGKRSCYHEVASEVFGGAKIFTTRHNSLMSFGNANYFFNKTVMSDCEDRPCKHAGNGQDQDLN